MIGCHFQDRPRRPSLCLRGHHAWIVGGELGNEPELRTCDARTEKNCEHRAWDHQIGLDVARSKSSFIGRCVRCGKRHSTLFDYKRCMISHEIQKAFEDGGKWSNEGSRDHLPHEDMPPALKASGWKEVRRRVLARDGFHCQECNKPLADVPSWFTEVHHIVPRERGGSDHPSNLKTLCLVCHRAYTNELLAQLWLETIIDASIIEARRKQLDLDHFVIRE
jgi:hypothetical protein